MPVGLLVLVFAFNWKIGLFCMIPALLGFAVLGSMMGSNMQEKMKEYQNALESMSSEATASLDAENETAIQEALSRLIQNKTVLIIAHRMRTIANADHIVVLKDGVVAEQGSPGELSAKDSIYSHMTRLQLASQNWQMQGGQPALEV